MAEPLVLLGQIVGPAFAAGLNLYATVAVVGLASRIGWIPALPAELQGLEDPVVIASAFLLYLIEFVVDKIPHLDSLWDTIHTFIRPTATALLSFAALGALPLEQQLAGAVLAGAVALAAHGAKAGLRLAINASATPGPGAIISVAEDALAVALAVAALRDPRAAWAFAAAAVLVGLLAGPILWRAFLLGLRALTARGRAFFGGARWRELSEVPGQLRALLEPAAPGLAPPRAARAALKGLRGVGAYRNGWLVITPDAALFLYRSLPGPRRLVLPPTRSAHIRTGPWANALELDGKDARYTLFLLKDGPPPEVALPHLAHTR
ncbi:MAG: DUF4126 domain-containing protein [Gemmatimonadetes bacterium]|nr:DUF4126 domain-containing protein [Gemmatimonadota bacterium]